MTRAVLLLTLGFLSGCATVSTRFPAPKAGSVSRTLAEVEQEVGLPQSSWPGADRYPVSDAVDLLRVKKARLLPDETVSIYEHRVTKILTERGKPYGQISIAFDAQLQKVNLRWAQTIRPDGTIVPIAREAVSVAAPFQSMTAFSSTHIMVLSMPSVEPGCVIDWGYDLTSKSSSMGNHLWDGVFLSEGSPVLQSSYSVTVPAGRSLRWHASGLSENPAETRDAATVSYVWSMKDLAPIELELEGPPFREVLPWVAISTVRNWEEVAEWWRRTVLLRIGSNDAIQDWVEKHTAHLNSKREKLKAIFEGLQAEIRYVALEFGRGGWEPHWAGEIFANRYGDCKDQAVLLLTMLKEVGIPAGPVLLRTASAGPIATDVPSPGEFNHAIVWAEADGEKFWLDPSSGACPLGTLPPDDMGVQALTVIPGGWEFRTTPAINPDNHSMRRTITLRLSEDGTCKGRVLYQIQGSPVLFWRLMNREVKPEHIETVAQQIATRVASTASATDHRFPDWFSMDPSLEFSVDFEVPDFAMPVEDDLVVVKPPPLLISPRGLDTPQRRASWWWGAPGLFQDRVILEIPDGYQVRALPKPFRYEDAVGLFQSSWTKEGPRLVLDRTYAIKDRKVDPKDWKTFRSTFLAYKQATTQVVGLRRR